MKIVFLDCGTLGTPADTSILAQLGHLELYESTNPWEVSERIQDAQVVITNKVQLSRKVLLNSTSLKLIVVTASVADIVDLTTAQQKGIEVRPIPDYATNSVAQFAVSLILTLVCRLDFYRDYVTSGQYSAQPFFAHIGDGFGGLTHRRVGIIGMGRIGRRVAAMVTALGAEVVYYSSTHQDRDTSFARVSLDEMLITCDVISIHSPLTEVTANLIDRRALELMKSTAVVVNTGRGGVIDESALAEALRKHSIAGAALDVFEREPLDLGNPLMSMINSGKLILTPHCAWGSQDAQSRLMEATFQIISELVGRS